MPSEMTGRGLLFEQVEICFDDLQKVVWPIRDLITYRPVVHGDTRSLGLICHQPSLMSTCL